LLLDEIGEMPVDLQPKLLRVLQEKVYYRVGSDKPQEADFRLISSTNRSPFDAIKDGNLREDLYYRINTIEIKIPPLRDRMEDVPMLAEHFLQVYAEKYKRSDMRFSEAAYNQMLSNSWRGNVRELQHAIERAVLLCRGNMIEHLDIVRNLEQPAMPVAALAAASFAESSPAFTSQPSASRPFIQFANPDDDGGTNGLDWGNDALFEKIGKLIVDKIPEPNDEAPPKDVFHELENGVVLAALKRTKGNKQAAANLLGLYRPRLYGMIKRHNLEGKI
jgi:DNA-binding NtrC family response regulator